MKFELLSQGGAQSKKDIQQAAVREAQDMLANGQEDPTGLLLYSKRVIEFLGTYVKQIESAVRDDVHKNNGEWKIEGATLRIGSSGDRPDYDEDSTYADLKKKLKAREELLKLARNSDDDMYDGDACLVPKVGLKSAGRETLVVSF